MFALSEFIIFVAILTFTLAITGFAQSTITITRQPANQTASLFADARFSLLASGDPPLNYQWRFNNALLVGSTNTALTITNVQRSDAGNYSVVVSNSSGSVTSQVATLTITAFNSMYEFGYSWTDTRGLAPDGGECNWWNNPDFYMHRASNGPLWPEYLSTNLGLAYVEANNYAQCGAGSVDVLNQAIGFRVPPKPELSLFFLMFGDDILLGLPPPGPGYLDVTNETAWNQVIAAGIQANSNAVARLYARGARAIVVQGDWDSSPSPAAITGFGSDTARLSQFGEYCARYNIGFSNAVSAFSQTKPDLRIVWVDLFSALNQVLANPASYGFTKTDTGAVDDPALTDKSFTGPGADYVWWNRLHVTTKLHRLISSWNLEALTNSIVETLEATMADGSPSIQMNHLQIGRDYVLQASTDLRQWQDIETFTAAAGTNRWTDASLEVSTAFYRLKWQP